MSDQPVDTALAAAVLEIESHAATAGWDQPAQLFALVDSRALVEREPALAATVGDTAVGSLTAVQQELDPGVALEEVLHGITWPEAVAGCAAVVERLVLPPGADAGLPEEAGAAAAAAAEHPERQEVRIVAAATRAGSTWCALRLRAHDDELSVLTGPDLVPGLVELVRATLEEDSP